MAIINFGGTDELVITREEFPLSRAQEVLRNETVCGFGIRGAGAGTESQHAG